MVKAQKRGELSSHNSDFHPYSTVQSKAQTPNTCLNKDFYTQLPSNKDVQIHVKTTDIPKQIQNTILAYNSEEIISEDDKRSKNTENEILPTSPNSTFVRPLRRSSESHMETQDTDRGLPFQTPRKFSSNFQSLIKEKTKKTLTTTRNRYLPLSDNSDSDLDDDLGRIVKRKRADKGKSTESQKEETIEEILATQKGNVLQNKAQASSRKPIKNTPIKKSNMPPIVVDGQTKNQNTLIQDLRATVKGNFSVKHTANSTILFVDDRDDHNKVLKNIQEEKISYHTYTTNEDKSHALVLRGLAKGTTISDIEEDLDIQYEIKTRSIFLMNTKNRPLYLVVTDPSLTLDYLNKNIRRVLYTCITWELRRSVQQIIQCRNCQRWGHATTNCGRPPRCLKCAGEHLTRTCLKSRETAAKCANCEGEHPANYSKCQAYLDRIERLEEKRSKSNPIKYVQAPAPKVNAWENKKRQVPDREEFPELRNRGHSSRNEQSIPTQQIPRPNPTPSYQNGNQDDFQALNAELNELHRLVNLSELTRAVRDLNNKLRTCLTNLEIYMTYQSFYDNINNYKFRN